MAKTERGRSRQRLSEHNSGRLPGIEVEAKAERDIASASKAMRAEGLVVVQFLLDERLKPRQPFMVSLTVRGAKGQTIVAEVPELGLSVSGRARTAVLDRLRKQIGDMYWELKLKPQANAARWATLQQMIEERIA